jgi:hypothetical protein
VIFYASTTPPEQAARIVAAFQQNLIERVTQLIGVQWTDANREALFQTAGCGLPDLVRNSHKLYDDARLRFETNNYQRTNSLQDLSRCLAHSSVDVTSTELCTHLSRQKSAGWLFTALRGSKNDALSDEEFATCLALRCFALPARYSFGTRDRDGNKINRAYSCAACCARIDSDQKHINHIFSGCKANSNYYTRRHNNLRDAIAGVVRGFGVSVETEPTLFSESYRDGRKHRPDLLVSQASMTATDFVVVNGGGDDDEYACKQKAQEKRTQHYDACNAHGAVFHAYAVSIHGWLDRSGLRFIKQIAGQLPFVQRDEFVFAMMHSTSLALAKARAEMIRHQHLQQHNVKLNEAGLFGGENETGEENEARDESDTEARDEEREEETPKRETQTQNDNDNTTNNNNRGRKSS